VTDKQIDEEKIKQAVAMFEGQGLNEAEALLASARLYTAALNSFKSAAPAYRQAIGEENIRSFATEELNDVIYEIQDTVPVALRLFNSLMRDAEGNGPPDQ